MARASKKMARTAHEVLVQAKAKLTAHKGAWIQGHEFAWIEDGRGNEREQFCMIGAVHSVEAPSQVKDKALELLTHAIPADWRRDWDKEEPPDPTEQIPLYNDYKDTTRCMVLRTYSRAIRTAEQLAKLDAKG